MLTAPRNMRAMTTDTEPGTDAPESIKQPRLWRDSGWTARVIKNSDDEGWAVEMILQGEPEPALVGPWTMGRDKKNPKPLDQNAFNTLVKTAREVLRRHEQQLHAQQHRELLVAAPGGRLRITLDIVPDEDDPHALLAAFDVAGELLARVRVSLGFKLSLASAETWIGNDFKRPS